LFSGGTRVFWVYRGEGEVLLVAFAVGAGDELAWVKKHLSARSSKTLRSRPATSLQST
jgi:hypothetical protein